MLVQDKIIVDAPQRVARLYTGRTWFQAPEIDGMTHVSGPNGSWQSHGSGYYGKQNL